MLNGKQAEFGIFSERRHTRRHGSGGLKKGKQELHFKVASEARSSWAAPLGEDEKSILIFGAAINGRFVSVISSTFLRRVSRFPVRLPCGCRSAINSHLLPVVRSAGFNRAFNSRRVVKSLSTQ